MKPKLSEAQLRQRREAAKMPRPSIKGKEIVITMPFYLLKQLPENARVRNKTIRKAVEEFLERQTNV